jgi:hypothetical protein
LKPAKFYIAADGPRAGNISDEINCKEVLDIVNNVDWDCEVYKNFSDINLGCAKRPSSAIDWVLQTEDRVIILEDDCFPSLSFFDFCNELLEKYKNNDCIMHIAGTRYVSELQLNDDSYFFSRYQRPWGWATWKRAWQLFDIHLLKLNDLKYHEYFKYIFDDYESNYWIEKFDRSIAVNTIWDYQWQYAIFFNQGLCIVPQKNLVSNLGNRLGTHLSGPSIYFNQPVDDSFRIRKHPEVIIRNIRYDHLLFNRFHGEDKFVGRVKHKLSKLFTLIGIK